LAHSKEIACEKEMPCIGVIVLLMAGSVAAQVTQMINYQMYGNLYMGGRS